MVTSLTCFTFSYIATAEPGDEESVTRAKYFIRDEFLVSKDFTERAKVKIDVPSTDFLYNLYFDLKVRFN